MNNPKEHKSSFDLYRISPKVWSSLPYEEAVRMKVQAAKTAMMYYKSEADILNGYDEDRYKEAYSKYKSSAKARDFNLYLLEELI